MKNLNEMGVVELGALEITNIDGGTENSGSALVGEIAHHIWNWLTDDNRWRAT